jgi:hypothetical protein
MRPWHAAVLVAVTAICVNGTALAQSIRLPDFRQQATITSLKPGEPCIDCGRILSIRESAIERKPVVPAGFQGSARGPVEHNFVGAVIYLPLSESSADKPFVGGVGTPEMKERFGGTTYVILIRMDDGRTRSVERPDGAQYSIGDRVRLPASGGLELIAD